MTRLFGPLAPFATVAGASWPRFRPPRFGLAPIGELPDTAGQSQALAAIAAAYGAGVRFFDTAPLQAAGSGEQQLATALAGRPRGEYLVSTRVGRRGTPDGLQPDFSAAGIRQAFSDSLDRLSLEAVDLCLLDDPADDWPRALGAAYPVLHDLREQGVLRAAGVASGNWRLLDRFVEEADVDVVVLTGGGYSLLDQSGAPLLARCLEKRVSVIAADVLPSTEGRGPAAGSEDPDRTRRTAALCDQYGVSLPQAALAFPARHPAVTTVLINARSAADLRAVAALVRRPVPLELWRELEAQGLA